MLTIERLESGAVTVLRLDGEIDEMGVSSLQESLVGCMQDQRVNVVLNLSNVNFVSYMGVGVLVEKLRQMRVLNGNLRLTNVNVYTDRLFRMVGVTRVFECFGNETEAIQSYRKAA